MNPLTSKFVSPMPGVSASTCPPKTPFQALASRSGLLTVAKKENFTSDVKEFNSVADTIIKLPLAQNRNLDEETKESSPKDDNISATKCDIQKKEIIHQHKIINTPESNLHLTTQNYTNPKGSSIPPRPQAEQPSSRFNFIFPKQMPKETPSVLMNPKASSSSLFKAPVPIQSPPPALPQNEVPKQAQNPNPNPNPNLNQNTNQVLNPVNPNLQNQGKADELYYEVIYSGTNRKKCKSQDGILILTLKKLTLLDDRGNKLSESINKLSATSLRAGEILTVSNNRKVEVLGKISRSEYLSGRCFLHEARASSKPEAIIKPIIEFTFPADSFILDEDNKVFVEPFLAVKLRPHQKEGVKFMYECLAGKRIQDQYGCILADSMGLGKSLQAVTLLYTLLRKDAPYQSYARKGIIVAPATLVGNWKQEIQKWLGPSRLCPVVCVGTGKEKQNLLKIFEKGMSSLLIISYDSFVKHAATLGKVCQVVICDEGHLLKNCVTKKNSSISGLACRRRILLTGTPLQNNLTEFYACVSLVNPGVLGDLSTFNKVFANPILKAQEPLACNAVREVAQARSKELWRVTEQFILRRTGTILQSLLPPRNEYLIFCIPSPLQFQIYQKFLTSKSALQALETGNSSNALSICLLLRKLVNHPDLIFTSKYKSDNLRELLSIAQKMKPNNYSFLPNRFLLSPKFSFTSSILQHSQKNVEKVVIVSSFTKTLDLLEQFCLSIDSNVFRLDGSTLTSKRMVLVNEFNNYSGHSVFLLSSKAGGCGLNLVSANRLILFDPDWNPSNDKQAMGRIWRDGQKKPVHIYRLLLSGTIEEKIYQRQTVKENLSSTVVDAREEVSKFSKDDIREIFSFYDKCQSFDKGDFIDDEDSVLVGRGKKGNGEGEGEGNGNGVDQDVVEIVKRVLADQETVKEVELDFTEAKLDSEEGPGIEWDDDKPKKKGLDEII